MGKIVYIMGKSSTGKDTIYRSILSDKSIKLKKIIPYTTRPIRAGEEDGVQYYFTDEAGFEKLKQEGKVIEDRSYDTCYGLWRYFTVNDESLDLDKNNYIIIGTLESYVQLRDYFGQERLVPIYVEVEDGLRLERALARERMQATPKYEEMCRRFLADAADFSVENLKEAGITRKFFNADVEKCVDEILLGIREKM